MKPPTGIVVVPGTDYWVAEHDSHLSRWAEQHGDIVSDPHVMRFLEPYVRGKGVVWDIGGNIGSHAVQYQRWGCYVVAIEPMPISFACLKHNLGPEALCLNIAASDSNGTVTMGQDDNLGASRIREDGEWTVPCHALDDLPDLPAPGYVKLDCEGFEPRVITGMAGTITRHKPILFVEMNRGALEEQGFCIKGLDDQIRSLGYREAVLYPRTATWLDEQMDALYLPQP